MVGALMDTSVITIPVDMHEHQVAMGETTTGGRRELRNPDGLLDYDALMLLTLQRARSAANAIEIVDELTRAQIGELAPAADAPVIVSRLRDGSEVDIEVLLDEKRSAKQRAAAADALGRMRLFIKVDTGALAERLSDDSATVRRAAGVDAAGEKDLTQFDVAPFVTVVMGDDVDACMVPIRNAICWAMVLYSWGRFPRRKIWAVMNKTLVNARVNPTAKTAPNTGGSFRIKSIGIFFSILTV